MEACQGRARFQQHRDARCHQVYLFIFFFLQGKAPKEIHAILTETLACYLPGRVKDLSVPLYMFRTDQLSIIRSLNTVYTATGICHASYVDSLLARSS